jgi:hypothetical protein
VFWWLFRNQIQKTFRIEGPSAIDHQHVAGDPTRIIRSKIADRIGNFGSRAKAAQRDFGGEFRANFIARPQIAIGAFASKWTRRNSVNANVVARPFDRQRAAHGNDTGFGGHRMDVARSGCQSLRMNDADDGPFAPADHLQANSARAIKRAVEHDVDHRIPTIYGKIFGANREISRGVVDQDVDSSEPRDRAIHHLLDLFRIANIEREGFHLRASLPDFGCGLLQLFVAASGNHERCAVTSKFKRRLLTQTSAASGDQYRLLLKCLFWKNNPSVAIYNRRI